jgi:hypothetical protein
VIIGKNLLDPLTSFVNAMNKIQGFDFAAWVKVVLVKSSLI